MTHSAPQMTRADIQAAVFIRYKEHLRRAAQLEGDPPVEIAQASAVLFTIAANNWLDDYKAWEAAQCN